MNSTDKEIKVVRLTDGCVFVHDGCVGILVGCVSEVVKYLANAKLSGVKLLGIVLSDTSHVGGLNNWAIEFPLYKNLFLDGAFFRGEKLVIVGTPVQLARVREIIRITVCGPSTAEYRKWGEKYEIKHALWDMLGKARDRFGIKAKDGRLLEVDELVELRPFEAEKASIGPFEVQKLEGKDRFSVSAPEAAAAEVSLSFERRPAPPFELHRVEDVRPTSKLGVTVLTYSNGFDPNNGCTALVLHINGVPVLWDAAPFVDDSLRALGLGMSQIGAVFLSHVHDDHSSILEALANGRRLRLYATAEVYESLLVKLAAILYLDLENKTDRTLLEGAFDYVRIIPREPFKLFGATLTAHYTYHTIPCIGMRMEVKGKGRTHTMAITGDTVGLSMLAGLLEEGAISNAWHGELMASIRPGDDLAVVDCGEATIHGSPNDPLLLRLAESGVQVVVGHRGRLETPPPNVMLATPGLRRVVLEGDAAHQDGLAIARALHTLGIDDPHELLALLNMGEVLTVSRNRRLIPQGDAENREVFVVLDGRFAVDVDGRIVSTLEAGDLFGEMAVLTGSPRTASVVSLSPSRVLAIPEDYFLELVERFGLRQRFDHLWKVRRMLDATELFSHIPADVLAGVAPKFEMVEMAPDRAIMFEGEADDTVYILCKGSAEVLKSGARVATVNPGGILGEMAATNRELRTATVQTLEACRLLRITGENFRALVRDNFPLRLALRTLMHARTAA